MQESFETPILFLIFNRPDTTRVVFEEIKKQKPKYLYVAADGPRNNVPGEVEKCRKTRQIIDKIDWPCEIKTLFRDKNLGCGKAVSSAITWFFGQVEKGIILEDDCVPHPDFFPYCEELLDKYKNEEKVMFIGGNNFQENLNISDSYYFSGFNHVWGWASWKRAWNKYDFELKAISLKSIRVTLDSYFRNRTPKKYWESLYFLLKRKKIDTWDYQLTFSIWNNKGLSIVPKVNLVSNIGFGEGATHTSSGSKFSELKTYPIMPLMHPEGIRRNEEADNNYISMIAPMDSIFQLLLFRSKFLLPKKAIAFLKRIIK